MSCPQPVVCDHGSVIRRQFVRIEQLESQLASLRLERDSLALENERLAFQLEMMSEALKQTKVTIGGADGGDCDSNMLVIGSKNQVDDDRRSYNDHGPRKSSAHIHHSQSPQTQGHHYELSQQLIDKRVSCLERKYGGRNARDAAITIQRAWRTYRLQKRFATIAIAAYKQHAHNCAANSINHQHQSQPIEQLTESLPNDHRQVKHNNINGNVNITMNGSMPHNENYHKCNDTNAINNNNKRYSAISSGSSVSDDSSMSISLPMGSAGHGHHAPPPTPSLLTTTLFECVRKRQYRVGLNLFNKTPPERGINFLVANGFIEPVQPNNEQSLSIAISRFLLTRKGLSKQMIGEYISSHQPFNQCVLKHFSHEIDLCGLCVDIALRKFQTYFRFPGEAQKIERLVEAFANRFVESNVETPMSQLSRDSVFILSFAIIMLNTDLHVPTNTKSRMTQQQWLNNLRGVFGSDNLDQNYLVEIYERVKNNELRTGADHVTQVLKVQQAIVGKDVPNLCLPHRRLVCYCRLYEIRDLSRKERPGQHQREVFLFNDMLLVTKLTNKSRSGHIAEYQYRNSIPLDGLQVTLFTSPHHHFGIRLSRRVDDRLIITFNARNELDRARFVEDLKESIAEMDEMEQLRITKSNSLLQLNKYMGIGVEKNKLTSVVNSLSSSDNQVNSNSLCSQISSQSLASSGNSSMVSANGSVTASITQRRCSSGSLDSGLSLSRDSSPNQQSNNNVPVTVESK